MFYRTLAVGVVAGLVTFHVHAQTVPANHARNLAAGCTGCHDAGGAKGLPALAGRSRNDLAEQMKRFRSGIRPSTVMGQLAKGYTDAEIDLIAAFFAAQRSEKTPQ